MHTHTHTRAQRSNLTQHTAIFCSNALSKMSGKEEQKHTVVSVNSISIPLQEKQKLSNEHDGQRLVQRKLKFSYIQSQYFPEGAQNHLVSATQWDNRCQQLKALKGVNVILLYFKNIVHYKERQVAL